MEAVLARLQVQEHERVMVRSLDADAHPQLARRLGVFAIPSIVIVKDRRPVKVLSGRINLDELKRAISLYATAVASSDRNAREQVEEETGASAATVTDLA